MIEFEWSPVLNGHAKWFEEYGATIDLHSLRIITRFVEEETARLVKFKKDLEAAIQDEDIRRYIREVTTDIDNAHILRYKMVVRYEADLLKYNRGINGSSLSRINKRDSEVHASG
jgi:hypothetical protein